MAGPQQNDAMTTMRELPTPSEPAAQPSPSTPALVRAASVDPRKRSAPIKTPVFKGGRITQPRRIAEPEIKSEFIALSYARDPESGQIVRVKVPNSMKVTLGLVASVENPTQLTDAELLVGDDGLTRAIRFIR